ncbi:MAG: hypothetical protein GXZ08_00675 [Tissierellia bacterium]|nr:hypothetical protein [Tissierellia bacterium]
MKYNLIQRLLMAIILILSILFGLFLVMRTGHFIGEILKTFNSNIDPSVISNIFVSIVTGLLVGVYYSRKKIDKKEKE